MKIEKGIPLPKLHARRRKYPFAELEVGDSFLVQWSDEGTRKEQADRVRRACWRNGKRLERRFTSRARSPGVRVWRVE